VNHDQEVAKVIPLTLTLPGAVALTAPAAPQARSALRRIALLLAGWALLTAGACLFFLPGPGVPLVFAGLALLGQEQQWARRLLDRLKERVQRLGSIWKARRAA
jgi:hypothetical protein